MKKVIFCLPFLKRPTSHVIEAFEAEIPLIKAAGWDEGLAQSVGSAYISWARSELLRRALDVQPTAVVFIDYDLSWRPGDVLKLIETPGDVVAGTYRFKQEKEEYMGGWHVDADGRPVLRANGCIKASGVPAGFLKITPQAVGNFMEAYPNLIYGERWRPCIDIFNHGAFEGVWWGEDMAFSRRWNDRCGELLLVPDLEITHWLDDTPYKGNLHEWLMRQPGGSHAPVA